MDLRLIVVSGKTSDLRLEGRVVFHLPFFTLDKSQGFKPQTTNANQRNLNTKARLGSTKGKRGPKPTAAPDKSWTHSTNRGGEKKEKRNGFVARDLLQL